MSLRLALAVYSPWAPIVVRGFLEGEFVAPRRAVCGSLSWCGSLRYELSCDDRAHGRLVLSGEARFRFTAFRHSLTRVAFEVRDGTGRILGDAEVRWDWYEEMKVSLGSVRWRPEKYALFR